MTETKYLTRNRGIEGMANAEQYMSTGGYEGLKKALSMPAEQVVEELKASGLRGRGGAGFPTWKKMTLCREAEGDVKYVVCNADEGEPGTNKDRVLLTTDPHNILEGLTISGYCIGAHKGYIYLRAEYPYVLPILKEALRTAHEVGALGKNIFGSGFDFEITIRLGAGAYVCGEETALYESIEGRRGEPRVRPPYSTTAGLFGKPTCENNVETLANLPLILRQGAAWYAGIGYGESHGTKLLTVIGNVSRRGVYEFPFGISLRELIFDVCGGVDEDKGLLAVQLGGASGRFLRPDQLDIPLDLDEGRVGCGTIFVIDDSNCILDITRNNVSFFCHESCGKCVPCREGTHRVYRLIDKLCRGEGSIGDLEIMKDVANTIVLASFCGLGKSSMTPVLSAMENFPDEFVRHIDGDDCECCRRDKRKVI